MINLRNSNIELLRTLSIFMIFCSHIIGQSNITTIFDNCNSYPIYLLSNFGRIASNLFLIISCYYLVDKKPTINRIVKSYILVAFYCVSLTIFSLFTNNNYVIKDIIRGFMPFFGRPLWFMSAYISLLIMIPFLNLILSWNNKDLTKLLIAIDILICFVCTLPDVQESYVLDTVWFSIVYINIGFIKKKNIKLNIGKYMSMIIAIILYVLLVYIKHYSNIYFLTQLSSQYLSDIKTIPNIVIAGLVFYSFLSIKEKNNKFINNISKGAAPTYVVHQVPAFYPLLWRKMEILCNNFSNIYIYIMYVYFSLFV